MSQIIDAMAKYHLAQERYFTALNVTLALIPVPLVVQHEIDQLRIDMDEKHADLSDLKAGHYE